MVESLIMPSNGSKSDLYESLIPQIEALTANENDLIANLSNIAAALKYGMNFFWVGFYFVKENELVLGPFQGPVACTRIAEGRGVCGRAVKNKAAVIVPDVNQFDDHIACSSDSKSEIVIPAIVNGQVTLILDVDSDKLDDFDNSDLKYLQQVIDLTEKLLTRQNSSVR
jgi:L-methionine (R)-S-oxide reductase